MTMPLVSVIMPAWNQERFIGDAVKSVVRQDFKDLELIIVDDGSTDTTRRIIELCAGQDSRIRVLFHDRNLGIAKSCNDGIEAAAGKFIALIDSDDVWAPDKLTKQLAVIGRDEDVIVWSEGELIDQTGQSIGKTFSDYIGKNGERKSGVLWRNFLQRGSYINNSTVLYKRQILGDIRYDEKLIAVPDFRFFLELARHHRFYYISEPLAKNRIHDANSFMGSNPGARKRKLVGRREYCSVVDDALRRYGDEIEPGGRAGLYRSLSGFYYGLGEKRESLRCFFQSVASNPVDRTNVSFAVSIVSEALRNFLKRSVSQGPDT